MRTRFTVCFRAKDHDGVLGEAVLESELSFAPTPEIEFEHSVWGEARRPTLVIFDIEDKGCLGPLVSRNLRLKQNGRVKRTYIANTAGPYETHRDE